MSTAMLQVLLVEDSLSDARLIREWLASTPDFYCQIKTAETLRDAFMAMDQTHFDAILLDLSLPDSFGMETLWKVHEKSPNTAIIVLTGFDNRELGMLAVQGGAQDYLVKGETEPKTLARAIHYAIERHRIEENLQQQHNFAQALREIATRLTGTLNLEEVLDHIFNSIGRVIKHDIAHILLLDDDNQVEVVRTQEETMVENGLRMQTHFEVQEYPLLQEMAITQAPLLISDLKQANLSNYTDVFEGLRGFLGVPIRKSDKTIGFITVFSLIPNSFSNQDMDRLMAFAEQAAIALQNAQLYQQSHSLAAFEERQRLARELHDSVSQTLFTCTTMAESALRRWESDPPKAHQYVQDVHRLTKGALAEMRVLLLELRPENLARLGLNQLVEQYILSLHSRSSIAIHLDLAQMPPLPSLIQITFYRILQESLNNIVKHAQAQNVHIRLTYVESVLTLTIQDDGRGFDTTQVGANSLGLEIMRERTEAIGAALTIESQPGQGTRLNVVWQQKEKRSA